MLFDYTEAKNETAAKKQARKDLSDLFYEFLMEKFGDEEGRVGYVGNNEIGFAFGIVKDKDDCPVYMVATVKPVIKQYQDHIGDKRTTEAYDFDQAMQDYAEENKK